FFFQAEDGIRDRTVTGVQTCALPIYLLHISFEAGILEDPWMDAFAPNNKDMFKLSVAPEDAPNKSEYVTLDFVKGNCVAVNGKQIGRASCRERVEVWEGET